MGEAPSLAELQARFQSAVMSGDDQILALIPANSRTINSVLLGVYRHAYAARLVEVVRAAHPLLARYMGEDAFEAMARSYVAHHPSRHANARWFAAHVPEFLAMAPFATEPVLRDLALIERQLDVAFDAADADVLDLAALAAFAPDLWGAIVFTPHPSAAVITLATNAFALWLALKNEEERPETRRLGEPQNVLVWREGTTPKIRELGAQEYMLWNEASEGASFGALAELAAVFDDPTTASLRVAQYFRGWLASGLISAAMTPVQERIKV